MPDTEPSEKQVERMAKYLSKRFPVVGDSDYYWKKVATHVLSLLLPCVEALKEIAKTNDYEGFAPRASVAKVSLANLKKEGIIE